jgi:myo-inositol-1(or 4)-monophosphatase
MIINAISAAKSVEKLLLKSFHKVRVQNIQRKSGFAGMVTNVDKQAEKMIKSIIRKKYPDHNILGEESGFTANKSDYTWVIDPLNGTHNYIMGNPLFCTAIAIACQNDIILSVVYAPFLKEFYQAEKGKGAWLNGKRLRVSKKKEIKNSIFYYCHGYRKADLKKALQIYAKLKMKATDIRQLGSSSIESAWVAAGRAEAYVTPGGKPWDAAPGVLIVREAGGKATDFNNHNWSLNSKDMVCSNEVIHKKFLKFIK